MHTHPINRQHTATGMGRSVAGALLALVVFASLGAAAAEPGGGDRAPVNFGRDILPILSDNCFQCHGPDAKVRKAGLRLDTQEGALRTTDPVIRPGQSDQSELVRRISSAEAAKVMPPPKSNHRLTSQQIELLRRWIDQGAKWGRHWAFEKPQRPPLPTVQDSRWQRNPIDQLVLARLEAEGLKPSPEAERTTLIRRLTLDLTGLPPTPAEVDAFLADSSPDAYEKLVDRLLASPHYGERMVWEWLDAARYSDSNGYQGDAERTMWPWRDWAIDALNRNMPFDQFTVWQLAGDPLPNPKTEQRLATAFCRNHMINGEGGRIPEENRIDYVMDMAETAGTVWLGLTFNCCRCHDHKFDALTQRDYYGLFAFFNQTPINGGGGDPQTRPVLEVAPPGQREKLAALDAATGAAVARVDEAEKKLSPPAGLKGEVLAALKTPAAKRTRPQVEQLEKHYQKADPAHADLLRKHREALAARDAAAKAVVRVMVMEDMPKPRETFLLVRGSYEKPGEKVSAGVPASLPGLPAEAPRNRLGLARWLVSPDNPLTARVTINRTWQQFFGAGLVKTPEDFGVQGEGASHPALLDWLASEFARTWDVKHLHRLIVTSAAYRQSSK